MLALSNRLRRIGDTANDKQIHHSFHRSELPAHLRPSGNGNIIAKLVLRILQNARTQCHRAEHLRLVCILHAGIVFPQCDVRFIAVNDSFDSANGENEFMSLKNLFKEIFI